MKITKEYIQNNLLTKNSALNSNKTKYLSETPEDLYKIMHNIQKSPLCYCGNTLTFLNFKKGYTTFCSSQCVSKDKEIQRRRAKTYKKVYKEKKDEILSKKKATTKKHFGVAHHTQSTKWQEKYKQYLLDTYGVDNIGKIDGHSEKCKATSRLKYGTDHPQQYSKIRSKSENTCLKKYGVSNPLQSDVIKTKIKKTTVDRFGVKNVSQSESIKQKKEQTYLKHYSSFHYLASDKRRRLMESEGKWITSDQKSDYEYYTQLVWCETRRQNLASLNHFEKRGVKRYHLDHKFSIMEGFKNGILPHIIGGLKNLEFIPYNENCSKGSKCSINLSEIIP